MAITFISAGAISYSTAAPTPATPAHSVGDILILSIGTKPDTAAAEIPAGWIQLGFASGGTGVSGRYTGPMRAGLFYRIADGSANDTPNIASIFGNSISAAQVFVFRMSDLNNSLDIAGVGAADTTVGSPFSVTMPTNPGLTTSDALLVVAVSPTDAATYSTETVAAPGMTTVSLTEINEWKYSTNPNRMGGWVARGTVVTGTSTGVPTVSSAVAGTATDVAGPIYLIRLREVVTTVKSSTDTAAVSVSDASSNSIATVTSKSATDNGSISSTSWSSIGEGASGGAPSVRAAGPATTSGGTTSWVLNTPTGTAAGDLMLATFCQNGNAAANISAPSGWTRIYASAVDGGAQGATNRTTYQSLYVFKRTAVASEPATHTFTGDVSVSGSGGIISIQNADTADFSGTSSGEFGSATVHTINLVINATSLLVSTISDDSSSTVVTAPTGWTEDWNTMVGQTNATAHLDNQPAGSYDITWNLSLSKNASLWAAGVKGTGGASTTIAIYASDNASISSTSTASAIDAGTLTPKTATDTSAVSVADTSAIFDVPIIAKSSTDTGSLSTSSTTTVTDISKVLPAPVDTDEPGMYIEPESLSHNPPIMDSNGNIYKVLEHEDASGPYTIMLKSADGGMTWHIQNSAVIPTGMKDLEGSWTEKVGTNIWFGTTQNSGDAFTITWFRMSDAAVGADTWSGTYIDLAALGGSNSAQYQWGSFVHLSNGDLWAFYHDSKYVKVTKNSETSYTPGTYQSQIMTYSMPVRGANDNVYIFYSDNTTLQTQWRKIAPGDSTVGAANRVDTTGKYNPSASAVYASHTNAVYYDNAGVEVISCAYAESNGTLWLYTLENGVPARQQISTAVVSSRSAQQGATSGNIDAHVAVDPDNGTVYVVWTENATGTLMYRTRAVDGTLGAESVLYDPPGTFGTTAATGQTTSSEIWYPYPKIWKYPNGQKVLAYTYDLGNHPNSVAFVKYNELPIASAPALVPISGSDSASISVSSMVSTTIGQSVTDTGSIGETSARQIFVTVISTDTSTVGVTESISGYVAAVAADTQGLAITEVAGRDNSLPGIDSVSIGAAEVMTIESTLAAGESNSLSVSESMLTDRASGSTDAGAMAVTETTSSLRTLASNDAISISLADISNAGTSLPGAESISVGVSESTLMAITAIAYDTGSIAETSTRDIAVTITITDTSSIATADASIRDKTIAGNDAAAVTVTETSGFYTYVPGSDNASLGAAEVRAIESTSTRTESNAIGISDSAVVDVISGDADTANVSATETSQINSIVTRSDASFIAVTEASGYILSTTKSANDGAVIAATEAFIFAPVGIISSDISTIAVTESNTSLRTVVASDTLTIGVAELGTPNNDFPGQDTSGISVVELSDLSIGGGLDQIRADIGSISVLDTSAVTIGITASDSSSLTVGSTNGIVITGTIAYESSDTLTFGMTDVAQAGIRLDSTDAVQMAVDEAVTGAVIAVAQDTTSISLDDSSTFGGVHRGANDAVAVSLTETASIFMDAPGQDSGSLLVSETSNLSLGGTFFYEATDASTLSASETVVVNVQISTTDAGFVAVSETVSFESVDRFSNDTNGLTVSETSVLGITLVRTDAAPVSISEIRTIGSTLNRNDVTAISATDSGVVGLDWPGSDFGVLTVTESANVSHGGTLVVESSDISTIATVEDTNYFIVVSTVDASSVSVSESIEFAEVPTSAQDIIGFGVHDVAVVGKQRDSEDTASIMVTEASDAIVLEGLLLIGAVDEFILITDESSYIYRRRISISFASNQKNVIMFNTQVGRGGSAAGGIRFE